MSRVNYNLSDLFFNAELPNFNAYCNKISELKADRDTYGAMRDALIEDAESFITMASPILNIPVPTAQELADDFIVRM